MPIEHKSANYIDLESKKWDFEKVDLTYDKDSKNLHSHILYQDKQAVESSKGSTKSRWPFPAVINWGTAITKAVIPGASNIHQIADAIEKDALTVLEDETDEVELAKKLPDNERVDKLEEIKGRLGNLKANLEAHNKLIRVHNQQLIFKGTSPVACKLHSRSLLVTNGMLQEVDKALKSDENSYKEILDQFEQTLNDFADQLEGGLDIDRDYISQNYKTTIDTINREKFPKLI